jgi:hypothetical protein
MRRREGVSVDGVGGLVERLKDTALVSETDVRTQVAVPLLDLLGYPSANRAEEFPIYAFEGEAAAGQARRYRALQFCGAQWPSRPGV